MITSTENKKVKNVVQLNAKSKARRKAGLFVVEGIKMFLEAPKTQVAEVYISEGLLREMEENPEGLHFPQVKEHLEELRGLSEVLIEEVTDSVFKVMSDTLTPQGILTVVKMKEWHLEDLQVEKMNRPLFMVLESLQDPGNLGTIIRTGEGAGVTAYILNKTTVDLYNPKTIRATMGSIYRKPVIVVDNLSETISQLRKQGVKFFAAHLKGQQDFYEEDYSGSCGFLIGNEGNGLSEEVANLADTYIKIPMEGEVESLNAAIAAAILMYEAKRQR